MRCSARWLCPLGDRIMHHLAARARSSPAAMAAGPLAGTTRERIDERCRVLARVGFLVLTYGAIHQPTTV